MMGTSLEAAPRENEFAATLDPATDPVVSLTNASATARPTMVSRCKSWPAVEWLPMQLNVALPIPKFRVRDLLALDPGQTITTEWPNGDDLPLSIEDVQLAWIEMESVDQDMAVRITRLL